MLTGPPPKFHGTRDILGCRNTEDIGNLCRGHNAIVLAMCAERLAPYGVTPTAVTIHPDGYVTVKTGPHSRYVREHKLIMEQILGRELRRNENVHHKNGDRADNRPENLELWVKSQPAGQRPDDLVAHAKRVLRHYDR